VARRRAWFVVWLVLSVNRDHPSTARLSGPTRCLTVSAPTVVLFTVVGRRSSVVGRRSSVVGRRSSVVGRRSSVVGVSSGGAGGSGQAVACPVVILPQGWQRVRGRRRRSGQRCVAPWRLAGPVRRLRRPSGGDQACHVPAAGWSSVGVRGVGLSSCGRVWWSCGVTVRWAPSGNSTVRVCSATWTATVWAWLRPRESFCPATRMTPVAEGRRCTVIGSTEGRGGGPAGRAPRSLRAWS
jgi:hypothetical protein